ncbi:MAG: hypothetical protein NXI16_10350 [Alphaproteobacteria bacterium]|nr:hypothetical protein [Alphaproteobacteria bacterium]
MITRLSFHRSAARAARYNVRGAMSDERVGRRTGAVTLLNTGIDPSVVLDAGTAISIFEAAADNKNLRYKALNAVLSPMPNKSSVNQLHQALLSAFLAGAAAIDCSDRIMLTALHAPDGSTGVWHLHAAIALPHPLTGRSIPLNRIRVRFHRAVREYWQSLRLTDANDFGVARQPMPRPEAAAESRKVSQLQPVEPLQPVLQSSDPKPVSLAAVPTAGECMRTRSIVPIPRPDSPSADEDCAPTQISPQRGLQP